MLIPTSQVIEAIKREPLTHDTFIDYDSAEDPDQCAVCAVGAVIRSLGRRPTQDIGFALTGSDCGARHGWELEDLFTAFLSNHVGSMRCLSIVWESLADRFSVDDARDHLVEMLSREDAPKVFELSQRALDM